ncbi:hypothetical protein ACFQVD_07495 [Streptosporangium amethystogenes subsp. fukuiense]|uniref:ATP-binding protein n=1 Tax=Streptosporangium amethystogenes subsp. fukuiense TaxID=698418 RepID=A0ABW2SUG6_9ACTN
MTNFSFTQISGVNGPVQTSNAPLNIGNYYQNAVLAGVTTRSPRANAVDDLERIWQRFVYPSGFGRARELLETYRIVLLDGAPGSGRVAAAKTLLYELFSGDERFRELSWEESDGKHRLDPDHIGDDDRVWLDLSGVEEQIWRDVQNELSAVRNAVAEHGAYLVVVLPGNRGERLRPEFGPYLAKIDRPPAEEVLRRHLRLMAVPGAVTSPTTPLLTGYLDADPPIQEIAIFAGLVAEAWANTEGDLANWYAIAHEALTGREQEVAKDVATLAEGPQRALLLAAAMLHGAHVDHVYRAATALLNTLGHPEDECPLLERPDLVEQFQKIDVEINGNRHVRFRKLGYDSGVRAYFWNQIPELRDGIQTWVEKVVDSADLGQEDCGRLVTRFAEQCLRHEYRQVLVGSVLRWSRGSTTKRRLWAAGLALRCGLTAEKHGRFFRQQIYSWSHNRDLPEGLARVITVMCAQVIAVHHPDEAMVRLHHRARREERNTIAREALVQLVNGDSRLRRQMLVRLIVLSPDGWRWEVDPGLFLEFADPAALTDRGSRNHPFIADADVRGMLAEGWRRVFTRCTQEMWRAPLRQWLYVALGDERNREVLLDILVESSEGRGNILGLLYAAVRNMPRPAADDQERHTVFRDIVLRKICAVQGIRIA